MQKKGGKKKKKKSKPIENQEKTSKQATGP